MTTALHPVFAPQRGEAGRWLVEELLPNWALAARHPAGGLVSALDAEGRPQRDAPRALLVHARLAYSFALAYRLGGGELALAQARACFRVIEEALRSRDGGFRQTTAEDGGRRDFYDLSFVVFAAAWMELATGEPHYRSILREVIALLDERMAHPAGGYRESLEPADGPRRQNPHMHLLEALLAAHRVTGEAEWLERARGIVELFLARFFDARTGSLIEFMDEELRALPGARGDWREPGHHFEWVWLLLDYQALSGDERVSAPAEQLYRSGMAHGLARFEDDTLGVIEAMSAGGRPLSHDRLLWPQTEYVKAEIARHVHLGDIGALGRAQAHFRMIRQVFFGGGALLWYNRIGEAGQPLETTAPTRVIYHVAFAAAELERADL
ncbi:AGE family epimerase/isomerase [Bosea sp. TWI1241]|uniref:AGE family epimerase/isomerase n=1 Tax=Bosea sp. TWI1241 TaxID=3148904 RepID=UPI003209B3BD